MNKKIAIFYNFLDNIGGAEILTLTLAEKLNADIYTTNIDWNKIQKMGFSNINIFTIGKVPINAPWKQQLTLFKFHMLNVSKKYDFFIISGDWAVSASLKHKPNLYYMHSPIREIWDSYEFVRSMVPKYLRLFYDLWVFINRKINKFYINRIDKIICNSKNVSSRLKKFLLKESNKIIYPPIKTKKYYSEKNIDKKYWLSVNRLFTHKRIEIQIDAFNKMPDKKLIIVGSYEQSRHFIKYVQKIKSKKLNNIEIKHWVSDEELTTLYSECTGFITTAKDEDFGMSAVEAMASGKPVIAPNEGGYKESVIDKENGILIDNIDSDKIIRAVIDIESNLKDNNEFYRDKCIKRALDFDVGSFVSQIESMIQ